MAMSAVLREKLNVLYLKIVDGKISQAELERRNRELDGEQLSLGIGAATEVRR